MRILSRLKSMFHKEGIQTSTISFAEFKRIFRLTEREKLDMEYRKQVLGYVQKYDEAGNIMKIQRYHVPDASTKSIPTTYIEEEEGLGGDGRRWEEEQFTAAIFKPGAKDAKVGWYLIELNKISN